MSNELENISDLRRPPAKQRTSYAEIVEAAMSYVDLRSAGGVAAYLLGNSYYQNKVAFTFLRKRKKLSDQLFYSREWTIEEIFDELRCLAKDLETCEIYQPPPETSYRVP